MSYKNIGKTSLSPNYIVSIYNRYGYLLGDGSVRDDPFDSQGLEIGDVGSDKIRLNLIDLPPIFKHVIRELPADFLDVAWISLAETNTKITAQDATSNR